MTAKRKNELIELDRKTSQLIRTRQAREEAKKEVLRYFENSPFLLKWELENVCNAELNGLTGASWDLVNGNGFASSLFERYQLIKKAFGPNAKLITEKSRINNCYKKLLINVIEDIYNGVVNKSF